MRIIFYAGCIIAGLCMLRLLVGAITAMRKTRERNARLERYIEKLDRENARMRDPNFLQ